MDMGVEDVGEIQSEFTHDSEVSFDLISNRIDNTDLSRLRVTDNIRIGPGFLIEELAKEGFHK